MDVNDFNLVKGKNKKSKVQQVIFHCIDAEGNSNIYQKLASSLHIALYILHILVYLFLVQINITLDLTL